MRPSLLEVQMRVEPNEVFELMGRLEMGVLV